MQSSVSSGLAVTAPISATGVSAAALVAASASGRSRAKDCERVWVAVHGRVLDVSNFLSQHRDDEVDILSVAGKDAYRTDGMDRYRKVGIPVIGRLSYTVLAFMEEIIPAILGR